MGMYNILVTTCSCPKCKKAHSIEAEFRFGFLNLRKYTLGETVEWDERNNSLYDYGANKRPENGNYIGEGYVECDLCHHDYWVDIVVKNDILSEITIRNDKQGYIKDK